MKLFRGLSANIAYNIHRGIQFRRWASVVKEYIKKGFTMNDELLKNAGGVLWACKAFKNAMPQKHEMLVFKNYLT